jgi:hypothetical protein
VASDQYIGSSSPGLGEELAVGGPPRIVYSGQDFVIVYLSSCIVRQQILVLSFAIVWSAGSKGFAERDPMDYTVLVRCVGSNPAREVVRDAPFTGGGLSAGDDVAEWTGHFAAGPDDLAEATFVIESGPLIPARIVHDDLQWCRDIDLSGRGSRA